MSQESDLKMEVLRRLEELGLPTDEPAVRRLQQTVETAQAFASTSLQRPPMRVRTAKTLKGAAERVLVIAEKNNLATREDLRIVRRLRRLAELDLMTPSLPGPERREWLWPACELLLEDWKAITFDCRTGRFAPDGVWERERASPALEYLEAFCKLVDPSVSRHAIIRAKNTLEPELSDEEKDRAYAEFCESPYGRKFFATDD